MADFNHGAFVAALRNRRGVIPADLYADLMAALDAGTGAQPVRLEVARTEAAAAAGTGDPPWLTEARRNMGLREVPGPRHEGRIVAFFRSALAGWFADDETPWCGAFAAYCMVRAGLPIPPKGEAVRALAWAKWGVSTAPRVGAVAVFGRQGGGHVGFVVGESADNLYILGGNQSNQVNITPIAKTRLVALRWPSGVPLSETRLPPMRGGTVSRNEA
ncbi:MAG: TIGR02594 family protein [Thermomonas sp.]|uniref:TIGR02594 family protein n=1 Tax=Thermomonas sp. TaxID=1971895 RepID=UPI0026354D54|nr:TIGR02594 family protein [Thermomonas sp.]MCC7097289.1 TIGR02594 family protein [Thermomonas sp.]